MPCHYCCSFCHYRFNASCSRGVCIVDELLVFEMVDRAEDGWNADRGDSIMRENEGSGDRDSSSERGERNTSNLSGGITG